MKNCLLLVVLLSSLNCFAQDDYVVQLNDTTFNVSLDKPYSINLNGKKVQFQINSKDTLNYANSFFNFSYLKKFKVSKTDLGSGIDQSALITAEGSGVIIQKYESLNPSALTDMMLTEITKESINYGFVSKRTKYKRTLKSGQELEVTRDVLTYKTDVNIYEVTSLGKKDSGLIIITMRMDDEANSEGQKLIDLMWESLRVK